MRTFELYRYAALVGARFMTEAGTGHELLCFPPGAIAAFADHIAATDRAEVAGSVDNLTERQKTMILHDYPVWQKFWSKHALGPLAAPSCLCCGQMTSTFFAEPHPSDAVIQHGELPGIVVCRTCRDKLESQQPVAKVEVAVLAADILRGVSIERWQVRVDPAFSPYKKLVAADAEIAELRAALASPPSSAPI